MNDHDARRSVSESAEHDLHPADDQLVDFVLGRSANADADRVAEHVLSCDRCAQRIDHLAPQDDQLVLGLRAAAAIGIDEAPTRPGAVADSTPLGARFSGLQIGKYRIVEQLGRGGMGTVYRAHDPVLDREVALKVLRLAGDESHRTRFLTEARAAAKLAHPNVVTVYDCGVEDGNYFLAMELLGGGSVADQLSTAGALPWRTATDFALQASRGLEAAHQAGLVHRDVKPANLLVGENDQIKVADFGLVKAVEGDSLTKEGAVLGSPHYMSPEQCGSHPADHRSDIYSLGATYYSLLTGQRPYDDRSTLIQFIAAHCHSPPPDPHDVDASLPNECVQVVKRAMAKTPAQRFNSCAEMESALARLLDSSSVAGLFGKAQGVRKSNRGRLRTFAGALAVIGLIAIVFFLISKQPPFQPGSDSTASGRIEVVDADRELAIRVLEIGGSLDIRAGEVDTVVHEVTDLPDSPFSVVWIALEHNPHVTNELLEELIPLRLLDGISLRGTAVSDTGMRHLSQIESLTAVFLSDTAVSDSGVLQLARLPNLSRLHLDRTGVSDLALQGLQNAALTILHLDYTRITDDGIGYVSAMQSLQSLTLRQTQVADPGVHRLRTLTKLQSICIAGTETTDAGLGYLHGMTSLTSISMSDPESESSLITTEGVKQLQVALPDCRVTFK